MMVNKLPGLVRRAEEILKDGGRIYPDEAEELLQSVCAEYVDTMIEKHNAFKVIRTFIMVFQRHWRGVRFKLVFNPSSAKCYNLSTEHGDNLFLSASTLNSMLTKIPFILYQHRQVKPIEFLREVADLL